ncbi:coenzyme F420-0:L-glutamate ligase [Halioxenophilus sp. WMMB6]|uniref:coenzyme F420-0:L-glutamate ligase n=1 Tax=Halioxenophilus sp. WMMB6 TaxID=3073815 RepID=UPI00295EDCDA|nr:coenzyme F420-0:L-glutamate ligase [Halioxenophilus sp. WMMB6]
MSLSFHPLQGIPEVVSGDDLAGHCLQGLAASGLSLQAGDVLVLAQKIVSKAEGRSVALAEITPTPQALEYAEICQKDARLVALILSEASEVVRAVPGVLIVRHRLGFVLANAGIDQSNVPGSGQALLLPKEPDHSATQLREQLQRRTDIDCAVMIADSFGRPWRMGVCGTCIGAAGLSALFDLRGACDREGREMVVTQQAVADQLCATATLVGGEADEGTPIVLIRGLDPRYLAADGRATDLIRPVAQDLFR